MPVAFQTSAAQANSTSATTIVINAPAGIVSGDLLVAVVYSELHGGSDFTPPAGWTEAGAPGVDSGGSAGRLSVFTRTAGGSEPVSYTFTGNGWMAGCILRYNGTSGLDTGTNPTFSFLNAAAAMAAPTVTAAGSTDALIVAYAPYGVTAVTAPAGTTARANAHDPSSGAAIFAFDKTLSSSGATGTTNTTTSSISNGYCACSVLLAAVSVITVTGTASVALGPLTVASTPGVIGACLRKAWLTLGGLDVSLEDPAQGYFCTQLDLGYPTVRQVINDNPDRDGATDRTQYLGSRAVSANITTLSGAGGRIDQVAAMFAPFMLPSNRPVLHYVLDRPGLPERTLTVRASGYSWPVSGPYQRDIQLQWVAADPVARDPNLKTATALIAGSATIATPGDVPVLPVFRITGPLTGPSIGLGLAGPPYTSWFLAFQSSFSLTTGHYVEIDTANRTVLLDGDPAQPRLAQMDWTVSSWQWIPPLPSSTIMSLTGSGAGPGTQVQAVWQDGYLT